MVKSIMHTVHITCRNATAHLGIVWSPDPSIHAYTHPLNRMREREKKGLGKQLALAQALESSLKLTDNQLLTKECYIKDDVATQVVAGNCILTPFLKFQPWPLLRLPVCPDPSFPARTCG